MKQILQYLFNHQTLTKAEAKAILTEISQGKFNDTEVTSFVTVSLMRSITSVSYTHLDVYKRQW